MRMCGRARLSTDYSETRIKLKFDPEYPAPNIPASWNVCPTDPMLVAVRSQDGKRIPQQMRWGLVPWWAKDIKVGFSSINARAETVDMTPAFRDAWKKGQRCLVVTDGFYEWKKPEKQPYAVAMADKGQMVMAGLWEEWTDKKNGGARQELYHYNLSAQCAYRHASRSDAGDPGRRGLGEVARGRACNER